MKLTGILKDKVDAVEAKEEKKALIAEAGMELTDDELETVAGGSGFNQCPYCGKLIGIGSLNNHIDVCPRKPNGKIAKLCNDLIR